MGQAQPIVVVYVRPADQDLLDLDDRLERVTARYRPRVRLDIIDPDNLPQRYSHVDNAGPAVLVLRHGELVGQAMGARLPARELDTVVRCAVEWPS